MDKIAMIKTVRIVVENMSISYIYRKHQKK